MKKIFVLVLIFTILPNLFAQSKIENPHFVSIGAGAPNMAVSFFNIYDTKKNFNVWGKGPFHFKYEYRLNSLIGLGLNVNNARYRISYTEDVLDTFQGVMVPNNITISSNNTAFNLRANIHFINIEENDKLDLYWGIGMGLKFGSPKISSTYEGATPSIKLPNINKIGFESTLGLRYMPITNLGIYAEIGLAKSIIQGGVTLRL